MHLPQTRRRRQKIDKGTCELQQKRQKILGKGAVQDISLAESLLGILYAHHLISRPLYEAGCFFGEIGYRYQYCLGSSFRPYIHDMALKSGKSLKGYEPPLSEYQEQKRTKAWREALQILSQAGPTPYKVVLKVVFYDHNLYTEALPGPLVREVNSLRKGLEHLDTYFKGGLRGKRDTRFGRILTHSKPTRTPRLLKACPLLAPP